MEDFYFHPKFAEAFRLGGFRLELHYHSGYADDEYEVHLMDLRDPELSPLRFGTRECRSLAMGLRFLEAMADASNGDAKAERTVERLRPLLVSDDGPGESDRLNALMKRLDRDRQLHNARIDAEWERVDQRHREERLLRKEAASCNS